MKTLSGKIVADQILDEIKREIASHNVRPGLAFVLVGKNPASEAYIKRKILACEKVGIASFDCRLGEKISEGELLAKVEELNGEAEIDGIIVQQPLPAHICSTRVIRAVDIYKDVDGFHPQNIGKLLLGDESGLISCTPLGIVTLLERNKISTSGKEVVIVGRSNIVGKPLAALLMQKGRDATVTVAHSRTKNLAEVCKRADILVAALGKPKAISANMVKPGAVVVDVGINRTKDQKLIGDVDYDQVAKVASAISPVPGGVGPMTIAMLLKNTWLSFKRRHSL
ncbi:MAG: bifunctional methylenetetrahydrofolate dehydrogenase/methenyltetrahydrofolate cyclohydrolase FolD [Candidatus Algichlamydia australiensis]|nr:bifunctional methylenetetrahydrofolate dehydrogenase/methenyltetrahydrofolate cyclohydrolase FolD [Chlamydiales bacterium]